MGRRDKRRARARKAARRDARRREGAPVRGRRRASIDFAQVREILRRKRDDPLDGTATDGWTATRVLALAACVRARAPKILADRSLRQPLVHLAQCEDAWVRPLAHWRARGKSRHTQLESLIDHLLVRWPVPPFLYAAFEAREPTDVDLFVHLAQGGGLQHAIELGLLPAQLTRAMRHLFMQTPGRCSVIGAVRRAQVLACGGDALRVREVASSFLGRELVDDAFWAKVLRWLCEDARVVPGTVGHTLDRIRRAREEDPSLCPSTRTLRALVRRPDPVEIELGALGLDQPPYDCSGFAPAEWIGADAGGGARPEVWTIVEILHPRELAIEGTLQRHCVYTYDRSVRCGSCSIWSLRRNGQRRLTIEVWNDLRRVVQVRGRGNRSPRSRETVLVSRWAAANGLELAA